jgi:hypothetical protein
MLKFEKKLRCWTLAFENFVRQDDDQLINKKKEEESFVHPAQLLVSRRKEGRMLACFLPIVFTTTSRM